MDPSSTGVQGCVLGCGLWARGSAIAAVASLSGGAHGRGAWERPRPVQNCNHLLQSARAAVGQLDCSNGLRQSMRQAASARHFNPDSSAMRVETTNAHLSLPGTRRSLLSSQRLPAGLRPHASFTPLPPLRFHQRHRLPAGWARIKSRAQERAVSRPPPPEASRLYGSRMSTTAPPVQDECLACASRG